MQGFSWSSGNNADVWGDNPMFQQIQPKKTEGGSANGKYVVSTNSSTQIKTINGIKTTKTVITKIYNDGSKEVEEN
jgi:hypothetical protein